MSGCTYAYAVRVSGYGACWIWGQLFGFRDVDGACCGVSEYGSTCGTVRAVCAKPPAGF